MPIDSSNQLDVSYQTSHGVANIPNYSIEFDLTLPDYSDLVKGIDNGSIINTDWQPAPTIDAGLQYGLRLYLKGRGLSTNNSVSIYMHIGALPTPCGKSREAPHIVTERQFGVSFRQVRICALVLNEYGTILHKAHPAHKTYTYEWNQLTLDFEQELTSFGFKDLCDTTDLLQWATADGTVRIRFVADIICGNRLITPKLTIRPAFSLDAVLSYMSNIRDLSTDVVKLTSGLACVRAHKLLFKAIMKDKYASQDNFNLSNSLNSIALNFLVDFLYQQQNCEHDSRHLFELVQLCMFAEAIDCVALSDAVQRRIAHQTQKSLDFAIQLYCHVATSPITLTHTGACLTQLAITHMQHGDTANSPRLWHLKHSDPVLYALVMEQVKQRPTLHITPHNQPRIEGNEQCLKKWRQNI